MHLDAHLDFYRGIWVSGHDISLGYQTALRESSTGESTIQNGKAELSSVAAPEVDQSAYRGDS